MSDIKYLQAVWDVQEVLETAAEEEGIDLDFSEKAISDRIGEYVETRVDPDEAVRYVAEDILDDAGVENTSQYTRSTPGSQRSGSTNNEQLTVDEIHQPNQWIQFTGTVIETFDTSTDSIAQQGRIADETGAIRFTIWESAEIDTRLERGETYALDPVVINEFQGEFEIKIANVTNISQLQGEDALDIHPDEYTETISGTIVQFQDEMGLVDRCPNEDCRRVLQEVDYCPDCGNVDSELDLRTKAILDTGDETWTIFLDEEDTEALAHINLEQAREKAREHNSRDIVEWKIKQETHGEFLKVWGRDRGRRFDVEDFELSPSPTMDELNQLQEELEALPKPDLDGTQPLNNITDVQQGPQPSRRTFAREFNDAVHQETHGDDEQSPKLVLLPTGQWAHRVFVVGTLVSINENAGDGDYTTGELSDPTGTIHLSASQYAPEGEREMQRIDTPQYVAVTGKTDVYESGGETFVTVRVEQITPVDDPIYDQGVADAAIQLIRRLKAFTNPRNEAAELATNVYGDDLGEYRDEGIGALEEVKSLYLEEQDTAEQEGQESEMPQADSDD